MDDREVWRERVRDIHDDDDDDGNRKKLLSFIEYMKNIKQSIKDLTFYQKYNN